ncbi:hypothetical protein MSP7336_03994 [Mycobacterium shimoidei]|uniref:Uncharacterized protein n=1 Tax=Mycobacterium shimoidei TaxID=29313 RepID=A0A375Z3J3_MYCSH|nr:hypothetical protein MSP7336_03994 [Mycobacterium shimoidei]
MQTGTAIVADPVATKAIHVVINSVRPKGALPVPGTFCSNHSS